MNLCDIVGHLFCLFVAKVIVPIAPGKRFKAFLCIKLAGGHYPPMKPTLGLNFGQCKYCKHIPDYLKELK